MFLKYCKAGSLLHDISLQLMNQEVNKGKIDLQWKTDEAIQAINYLKTRADHYEVPESINHIHSMKLD